MSQLDQVWNLRKKCPVGAVPASINYKPWLSKETGIFVTLEWFAIRKRSLSFQRDSFHYFGVRGVRKSQKMLMMNRIVFFMTLRFCSQGRQHPLTSAASPTLLPAPVLPPMPSKWFSCPLPQFPHEQTWSSGDQLKLRKAAEVKPAVLIVNYKLNKLLVLC